jgi:hypothetical protein
MESHIPLTTTEFDTRKREQRAQCVENEHSLLRQKQLIHLVCFTIHHNTICNTTLSVYTGVVCVPNIMTCSMKSGWFELQLSFSYILINRANKTYKFHLANTLAEAVQIVWSSFSCLLGPRQTNHHCIITSVCFWKWENVQISETSLGLSVAIP